MSAEPVKTPAPSPMTTLPAADAACPMIGEDRECSRRLVLSECLDAWQREAERGEVDTGRYRLRYGAWGHGPALVLIPGLCSDARMFVLLMARLRSHFRCIAYDLPTGADDGARLTRYRHDDLVRDLFALLDHRRLRQCFLWGSSFGATIALAALAEQPRRFMRAIVQGGFARRPLAPAEVLAVHWARYLPGTVGAVPLLERLTRRNHFAPFAERGAAEWEFFLQRQGAVPIRAFAQRALLMHHTDLRDRLPRIDVPVLLVTGDSDPLVGKASEHELRAGLPLAARAEIERCGHYPHLTHPEVCAEVVRQFLLPTPCGSE